MFLLGISHPLTVPASCMTYDNDPSMPHFRPHKTKPGVCVVGAELGGGHERVYVHGGPPPLLSDRSELFLVPQGWLRRAKKGGSLSCRFIFPLPSRTTCLCVYHRDHCWTVKRQYVYTGNYSGTDRVMTRDIIHSVQMRTEWMLFVVLEEQQTEASCPAQGIISRGRVLVSTPVAHTGHQVNNLLTGNPPCQTPARLWRQTPDPSVSTFRLHPTTPHTHTHTYHLSKCKTFFFFLLNFCVKPHRFYVDLYMFLDISVCDFSAT